MNKYLDTFYDWWKNIDKFILFIILTLFLLGLFFSLVSTSLIASDKLDTKSYYFFFKHLAYIALAIVILIIFSFLNQKILTKLSSILFLVAFLSLLLVPFLGIEVKGSKRWLDLMFLPRFQPIEIVKPFFIVTLSLMLTSQIRRLYFKYFLSTLFTVPILLLLVYQPDIGQTILITLAASIIYFISGMPLIVGFTIFILSLIGIGLSYLYVDHFYQRLNIFFNPSLGDTYQIDTAYNAILQGGWFGVGPGEGVIKNILPDAHTDFIFAVAAEEFGLISCFIIIFLFAFIIFRGVKRSINQQNLFAKISTIGLISLICLQMGINIAVNLGIVPTKGMTLPFISYGGSSAISIAITFGLILAFTRQKKTNFEYSSRKLSFQS